MAKRLQVILKDPEYREIQRAARSRRMSIAQWVRQALELARRHEPGAGTGKKLDVIRAAAQQRISFGRYSPVCSRKSRVALGRVPILDSGRLQYPDVPRWRAPSPQGQRSATTGRPYQPAAALGNGC